MSGDSPSTARAGAGVLGVGAAACVACCAGPIVGALSAIGIASVAGYLLAGSVAIVVGVGAIAVVLVRRRRRANACSASPTGSVASVAAPVVKASGHRPVSPVVRDVLSDRSVKTEAT